VRLQDPEVGALRLTFEALSIIGYPGWTIGVFTPAPGSASAERISVLAGGAGGTLVA
jgi:hypothetical protein